MFKKWLPLLLLLTIRLHAKPFDEVVSLGYSCQVAWQIKFHGFRTKSYPLDWLHTPSLSLLLFLQDEGKNLFNAEKMAIVGPYQGDPQFLHVLDLAYGTSSYHDFSAYPMLANYFSVKEKYDRRIKRFFELLKSKKRILFVRQGATQEEVLVLAQYLQETYPSFDFAILAIGHTEDYKVDWGAERIRNFYMPQNFQEWQGDTGLWKNIFDQFSIKRNTLF